MFYGMDNWQDVGQVLWCHSHLVRLVFEGSIPTTTNLIFIQKIFCDLFLCFFLFLCLGMVRQYRGEWKAKGKMHGL